MTLGPSRLPDAKTTLVLDASAALNLLGSGRPGDVLRVLGHDAVIVEEAAGEVERDPFGGPGAAAIAALAGTGLLRIAPLSSTAYERFTDLVAAPSPDGLDDGEAATIAHAFDIGAAALLDERKAERVARATVRSLPVFTTLDLLSSPLLEAALGSGAVADLVFSALRHARMRVPQPFRSWVIGLVGPDRICECPSIPRGWLAAPALARPPGEDNV
ncbi:MAG TPA: hypothetical protein VNZ61_26140 [Roseomonas sp.]|nr:hypothetical protein [Roseomonas sp.]